jgi:hypothetical protein
METTIYEFIIAAIGIVAGIGLVIVLAACALAPLCMGDNNKSIVDQAQDEPECELDGDKCECIDCWKKTK